MQNKMKKVWSMILVAAIVLSFFPGGIFSLNAEAATETDYETGYTWAFDQTVTLGNTKGLVSGNAAGTVKVMNHEGNGNALTPERAIADGVLTTEVVKNWGGTVGHGVFYQLPAALEAGRIYQLRLNLYGGNEAAAMNGITVSFGNYTDVLTGSGGTIQQWTSSGIEGLHNADTKITHSISGNLPTAASNTVEIEFVATEAMAAAGWMLVSFPLALNGSYKLGNAILKVGNYAEGYTWAFDQTVTLGNTKGLVSGNAAGTVKVMNHEGNGNALTPERAIADGVLTTEVVKNWGGTVGHGVFYKLPAALEAGRIYELSLNLYGGNEVAAMNGITVSFGNYTEVLTGSGGDIQQWTSSGIDGYHNADTKITHSISGNLPTSTSNTVEIEFMATEAMVSAGWMLVSFPLALNGSYKLGSVSINQAKSFDSITWSFDKEESLTDKQGLVSGNAIGNIKVMNHDANDSLTPDRAIANGVLTTNVTGNWNNTVGHGVFYKLPANLTDGKVYHLNLNLYGGNEVAAMNGISVSFGNYATTMNGSGGIIQQWTNSGIEGLHNTNATITHSISGNLPTATDNQVEIEFIATEAMEDGGWMLVSFPLEVGGDYKLGNATLEVVNCNYEDGYTWKFDKTVDAFTTATEFKTLYYGNEANTVGIVNHEGYGSNWGSNTSRSLKNGLLTSVMTASWGEEGHGVYYKLPMKLTVGQTYQVRMNLRAGASETPMTNDNSSSITVSFNSGVNTTQEWQISTMEGYHNAETKFTVPAPRSLNTKEDNIVSFDFIATQEIVDAGKWMLITFPMEDGKTYILGDTTIKAVNYDYADGYTWQMDNTIAFSNANAYKVMQYGNQASTVGIISHSAYANYATRSLSNGVLTTNITATWAKGANGLYYKLPIGLTVGQEYVVSMNLYASAEGTALENGDSTSIKLSFVNEIPTEVTDKVDQYWTATQIEGIHNAETLLTYRAPGYLSTDTANELAVTFVATQAMADNDGWLLISMPLAVNGEVNLGCVTLVEKADTTNHFLNGDFSDGLTGWMTNFDTTYVSVQDSVLNVTDKVPTGDVKLYQTIYLERGIYRLSFDVYGAPTSWRPVYFMGTALDNSSLTGAQLRVADESGKTEGQWWTVTRDVTIATAGTYYFQMNLNQASNGASVAPAMQYDNFALRQLDTVTVTWKNDDGTVLEEDLILADAEHEYNGELPTKAADKHNTYKLIGWDKEISEDAVIYTAKYETITSEHSWGEGTETKAPTCTEAGEMTYTCSVCGQTKTETILPKGEHSYNDGIETKAPTCGEDGEMTYTCSECGESYTEAIDATGEHTVDSWTVVTHPTTTDPGSKTGVCTVCGTTLTVEIPVVVQSWNIILSDNIGLNFILALTQDDEVQVTVDGEEVPVELTKNEDGTYKVFIEVAAAQMTSEIQIIVNGQPVEKTYSVRGYTEKILTGGYDEAVKTLVKHMLDYGTAAQNYFGVNTETPANADYKLNYTAQWPDEYPEMTTDGQISGVSFYGASLIMDSRVAVRYYFSADSVEGIDFTANGEPYKAEEKGDKYYVEVPGILPQDYGKAITVTAEKGEETLSVSYSPLTYMVRMSQKGSDSLKALVNAMYGYHLSAIEYLATLN